MRAAIAPSPRCSAVALAAGGVAGRRARRRPPQRPRPPAPAAAAPQAPTRRSSAAATWPRSATAWPATPRRAAQPFAGGRAARDAVRHDLFGQHHARPRDRHRRAGRRRLLSRACTRASTPTAEHLYPAFPYPYFTQHDRATTPTRCFAYLQTAAAGAPRRSTATSCRSRSTSAPLMSVLELAVLRRGRRTSPTRRSRREWNRGAYLVEGLGHCAPATRRRTCSAAPKNGRGLPGRRVRRLVRARPHAPTRAPASAAGATRPLAEYLQHRPQRAQRRLGRDGRGGGVLRPRR